MSTEGPPFLTPLPVTTEVRMYKTHILTQSCCERPDIYLDHDRSCDFCPYYPECTVIHLRRHSSEAKKKRREVGDKSEEVTTEVPVVVTVALNEDFPQNFVPVVKAPKAKRGRPVGSKNKPKE